MPLEARHSLDDGAGFADFAVAIRALFRPAFLSFCLSSPISFPSRFSGRCDPGLSLGAHLTLFRTLHLLRFSRFSLFLVERRPSLFLRKCNFLSSGWTHCALLRTGLLYSIGCSLWVTTRTSMPKLSPDVGNGCLKTFTLHLIPE